MPLTRLDLYCSTHKVDDGFDLLGAMLDVSFDPIEPAEFTDSLGLRHRIEGCARPTLTVGLGDGWRVTRELEITNVEALGLGVVVAGVRRDYLSPLLVLALARSGRNGARIIAGEDPTPADQSDLEVVTQRSLFPAEA